MKTLKFLSVLALTFLTSEAAQAQLPNGYYSGYVWNNAFSEWCRLDRAVMDFTKGSNGKVEVRWEESGYSINPGGSFCQNQYDATFTPVKGSPNTWTVEFHWNLDLVFGRATLQKGVLEINATYSGMRTSYLTFNTRLRVDEGGDSINYSRRIERYGPTLFASGVLYK